MVRTAVVAGTATAVSNRVSRRQAERWAQEDQSAYAQPQYAEPQHAQQAPAASGGDDMFDQLTQLAALRDKGILPDEEFAQQKARILAG
jgi:hypothetical protein